MGWVRYAAQRELFQGHEASIEYDLDILGTANRSLSVDKNVIKPQDGAPITLFNRQEILWSVRTKVFGQSMVDQIEHLREFLFSVSRGETFTFYPYSQLGDESNPVSVIMEGNAWREERVGIRNNYRANVVFLEV